MKNVLLCGINATFTHSNLALLCLKYSNSFNVNTVEFSINERLSDIIRSIAGANPDAVGFSCYIWNIEHVLKIASTLKRILPECFILLGGPEVSYECFDIMKRHPFIDMIIRGCGEIPFSHFLQRFESGESIDDTPGACIRKPDMIITTADAPPYDMNKTAFMFKDLDRFKNKIVYYETSRGCPFSCAYCMSASETLFFLPVERVKTELEYFIKANVHQVKFVDRTFNYPPGRAYEIIGALIGLSRKYLRSETNFHLEITASLLDEETIALLKEARDGLIQLEVGIQSTNAATLTAVNRALDTQKLLRNTAELCSMDNLHVHADLIAGLPNEGYDTFKKSFNDTYSLKPDTLQLGFLKLLKGSSLRETADKFCIAYTEYAPYEVLSTKDITYEELLRLHLIENVLNMLYNSGHFKNTLHHIMPFFPESAFAFYECFALYLDEKHFFTSQKKKQSLFEHLYLFAVTQGCNTDIIKEALQLDWLCIEKPRNWPNSLEPFAAGTEKMRIRAFFENSDNIQKYLPAYSHLSPREVGKRCIVFVASSIFPGKTFVLLDYGKKADEEGFAQTISPDDLQKSTC